jgi:hypothetical protein
MVRVGQIGIALGVLGVVLAFMGLFPGMTGLPPTPGIGAIQLVTMLVGFSLLIAGAFIYVKYTFYTRNRSTLGQQIALRLSMTGLLFAGMSALADILGFGSNVRNATEDIFFGSWQAGGLIGGFLVASLGVLIYALTGPLEAEKREPQPPQEVHPSSEIPKPADENTSEPQTQAL